MLAGVAVGRRTEEQTLLAETQSPGVVVGAAEEFELRPVGLEPEKPGPKPQLLAPDRAIESRVADDPIHPAIEAPSEIAWAGVRVAGAPATQQHLSQVGLAVAVGVFEQEHVRRLRHDQAAVVGQHACGDRQVLGEHVASVGLSVAIAVDECHDPVVARDLRRRIFLRWLDQIVWIVDALGHVEPTIGIEGLRQWLALEQRLRCEQLRPKTLGRDRVLPRLLGVERLLHLRERLVLLRGIVAGRGIEGHLRRLVCEGHEPRRRLRHHRVVDIHTRRRRIAARREADAAFDEVVKPRMAPGPLVVAPGGIENAALPLGADPGPRLALVALDPLFEHGAATVVVLGVHIGLIETLEPAKPLHHRMLLRNVHRAKFTRAVLLKLCPDEVDPGGRIAETKTRAVQRHEPLAAADKVEDGRFACGRERVDVGVDDERVGGGERLRIEISEPVGVDKLDSPRLEHGLELRKPLGWLVVPAVAQKQHLDGRLDTDSERSRQRRHENHTGQQERFHDEKLHSGSFMIAPPFMADSCARMPVQVQLALCFALG